MAILVNPLLLPPMRIKTQRSPSTLIDTCSLVLPKNIRAPTITCWMIASNLREFVILGPVTPVTIMPKILLQKTWDWNLEWDDDVGAHIANQFQHWVDNLGLLSSLAKPKCSASRYSFLLRCIEDGLWMSYLCQNNSRHEKPLFISSRGVTTCTREDSLHSKTWSLFNGAGL